MEIKKQRADKRKYHFIYKTICLITSKYYIGMHSTNNLKDGYIGSGKKLWFSIKKYGKENHKIEILEFLPDRKSLSNREKEIVNDKLLEDIQCMNLKLGGDGGFTDIKHQEKCLNAAILSLKNKRKNVPGFAEREKQNYYKMSILGRLIQEKNKVGCAFNEKIRLEMVERARLPVAIEKRKNTFKEIGHQQGEKNSQFGKMWIYNLETFESICIKKDEIILEGWVKGRKILKS